MEKNIEIGKRIKQRREELGMTQEELGNLLWLNKSTIQRYEAGKIAKIKLPVIHAMAKQLNVNPEWLILKTDQMGNFHEMNEWYEGGRTDRTVDESAELEIQTGNKSEVQLDHSYLSFAKEAQDEGIDPDDIRLAIETIKAMRNKK